MDLRSRHEHSTQRCRYWLQDVFLRADDRWVLCSRKGGKSVFWHCWAGKCNLLFHPLPVRGKTVIAWKLSAALLTLLKPAKLKLISGLMKWCSMFLSSLANRCISLVSKGLSFQITSCRLSQGLESQAAPPSLLSFAGCQMDFSFWIFSESTLWVLCSIKHTCTGWCAYQVKVTEFISDCPC